MRVVGYVALHPHLSVTHHRIRHDDHESIVVQLCDREVRFERTSLVHPLRVGNDSRGSVDLIARYPIETTAGVASLDEEFPHERHVHDDHVLTCGPMLLLPTREPRRPSPRQRSGIRSASRGPIPFRALPPAHLLEIRARG